MGILDTQKEKELSVDTQLSNKKSALDRTVQKLLGGTEKFLDSIEWNAASEHLSEQIGMYIPSGNTITQHIISSYCLESTYLKQHPKFEYIGTALTEIVRQGYEQGMKQFTLPLRTWKGKVSYVMAHFHGERNRRTRIYIQGDIGGFCLTHASHVRVSVDGNVGDSFAHQAHHINATVYGDVDDHYGTYAQLSSFRVLGNAGGFCGVSMKHSSVEVDGHVGIRFGFVAENSQLIANKDADVGCGVNVKNCHFTLRGDVEDVGTCAENSTFELHGKVNSAIGLKAKASTFFIKDKKYMEYAANEEPCSYYVFEAVQ